MDIFGAIGKLLGLVPDKKKKPQQQPQQTQQSVARPQVSVNTPLTPQKPKLLQPQVNTSLIHASSLNPQKKLLGQNINPEPTINAKPAPQPTLDNAVIKPTIDDANKVVNTVAIPVTAAVGGAMIGADKLFNGGKNTKNLINATNQEVYNNLQHSVVPLDVARGTASPLQFAKEATSTGIHYAPYVLPGGGKLAEGLGEKVTQNIANDTLRRSANVGVKAGTNAAIDVPTFAGLNAVDQGINSNFTSFDPNQAMAAGLQAGGASLVGGLAGGALRSGKTRLGTAIQRVREQQTPAVGRIPSVNQVAAAPRRVEQIPSPEPETVPPTLDTGSYLRQQQQLQDAARKQGSANPITNLRKEISSKLIDSLSPIENTLKAANKNGANIKIGDANHITTQLDRVLRSDTIAGQYVKDNGLADVIQNVPDTKALDQYLIAKHAADLEANGIKTGRNLEADRQLVQSLAPTYEPHAQAITKYNQDLLDKTVDYGLISKATATKLKKQYPNYVPANRIFGDAETNTFKGNGSGKASISGQSVVQRIKGSERQIESPLASIAAKTSDVIKQGERNKAASILASYKDLPGNPFSLRELKPSETVGSKPTISYIDNGKVRRFETTPEIAAAAKSLNKEQSNILIKMLQVPTRTLRLGATGVNVGFTLANLAKDMASAALNSKHPLRSSVLNPKALGKATAASLNHNSKAYGELLREGAGGTSFDIARDAPKQTVARIRADKNAGTKTLYTVTHPGELLRAVENTIGRSEEFTRALQYYGNKGAALAKGASEDEAKRYGAHAARNNTINFARAGEYGSVLNSVLPYLNAGIQGARTFVRNTKERPLQTAAKVAVLSTLPTVTTTLWNISDPKRKAAYDDISDYEKEGNIIIVPDNPVKDPTTGRWNVVKIPVSQELANLNNIARNGVEAENGDKNFDSKKALAGLVGTTTSLNVGSAREAENQLLPQALKPGIEALNNKNLFTGNDIVPESQKELPASEQYGDYTSGTAKTLGKALNLSPRQIDNFIKTSTGGAGQTALNVSDNALANAGVISPNEVKGTPLGSSISNRFLGASSTPSSQYADDAYRTARDQLIKSPEYAALSQDDKAKALNRLQTDVNAVTYSKQDALNPGNGYEPKKLTTNQRKLQEGTRSATDYTKSTDPSSETYADKYQSAKEDFDTKSKDWSTVQKAKKQKELNKLAVQKDYDNDTVDLYGMSKQDVYNLVSTDPDGKKKVEGILSYGDALVNAGLEKTNKFRDKYGNVKLDDGSKKSGSGKKGGKKGRKSSFKIPKSSFNRVGSTAAIRKLLQSSGKAIKEKS